jgi:hypothetical protein
LRGPVVDLIEARRRIEPWRCGPGSRRRYRQIGVVDLVVVVVVVIHIWRLPVWLTWPRVLSARETAVVGPRVETIPGRR